MVPSCNSCIDQRLSGLEIEHWTNVRISNEFAAKVISLYLKTEHPTLGLFDSDLFVRDLTAYQHNYCSPLLVNIILCNEMVRPCHFPQVGSS